MIVEFDCDDGYPTGDSIDRLRAHRFEYWQAPSFLLSDFPAICSQISCCAVDVIDDTDFMGSAIKRVSFSTGGWSGAEELIGVLLNHMWIRHFHTKWERGGHYEFEVPDAWPREPGPLTNGGKHVSADD